MKPDGVSAEIVRAAFDDVLRFVICPRLIDELGRVLARDKFRDYLTRTEEDVFVDAIAAISDATPDPEAVPRVSADPNDDYLIALARRESVDGIISGDSDLAVEGGPPVLPPGDVLRRLQLGPMQRRLLVTALWNLQLRLREGMVDPEAAEVSGFLAIVRSAVAKLGGDPGATLFGVPNLAETRVEIRDLSRGERTACAHAIEWDRRTTRELHAEHVDEVERLAQAFAILDRYVAIERLLSS